MVSRALLRLRRFATRRLRTTTLGTCLVFAIANQIAKVRMIIGDISAPSGTPHTEWGIETSITHIRQVHQAYLAAMGEDRFRGRVAEIGPGDNAGVALLMLNDGATSVDLLDRFYIRRNPAEQALLYGRLFSSTPALSHLRRDSPEGDLPGVRSHYGEAASAERFFLQNRGYDFIVSHTVLEHVKDPIGSLSHMRRALAPGGAMVHIVDLRDHEMFTGYGFEDLKFLEIPSLVYREMSEAAGRPNRVPLSAYRGAFPEAEIAVTDLIGGVRLSQPTPWAKIPQDVREAALALVRRQKPRLAARFRKEADEDLAVGGFTFVHRA